MTNIRRPAGHTITLERHFDSPIEDIWELWTTKEGIESWWGPDGFRVEVRSIDLRPGGELVYAMIAVEADRIAFVQKAGMPTVTETRIRYTEVAVHERLRYANRVDFVPGVDSYEAETLVELFPGADGVRMVLTLAAMHDEHWTRMAVMGWESQLDRLAAILTDRRAMTRQ